MSNLKKDNMKQIEKHLDVIREGVRVLSGVDANFSERMAIKEAILRTCDEVSVEIGVMGCSKKNRDADASI